MKKINKTDYKSGAWFVIALPMAIFLVLQIGTAYLPTKDESIKALCSITSLIAPLIIIVVGGFYNDAIDFINDKMEEIKDELKEEITKNN